MKIVEMDRKDFECFWPVFRTIVQAQETYAFDPEIVFEEAYELWCLSPQVTFAAKEDDTILGTYYLKKNASGPGSHISNCGYMVAPAARGQGVARSLCLHSQQVAIELGYSAMQFNSVVSTNEIAVRLWQNLGFDIIGKIPLGYKHMRHGFVDTFIMHKQLRS